MSTKKVCRVCLGSGKKMGRGMMSIECDGCSGDGFYFEEVNNVIDKIVDDLIDQESKNNDSLLSNKDIESEKEVSIAEDLTKKKRGKKKLWGN